MSVVFPFVVGCNRSGTTMLRGMLDSHPELAVPPEAYFVVPILCRADQFRRGGAPDGPFDGHAFLADLRARGTFRDVWALPDPVLDALEAEWEPQDVPEALTDLYASYATQHGKSRYADKTPQHVMHIDRLAGCFPQARFVHLVRDGRDVVPSLLDYPHGPKRFADAVEYWRYRVRAGLRAGAALSPDRYREIRYEALVDDPEAVLRDLCDFIELQYRPEMLGYHDRAGELLVGAFDPGHHHNISRPPTKGIRNWRVSLSPRQVQLFEVLAGDLLDELGYERSGLEPSAAVRAEAGFANARRHARTRVEALRRRATAPIRGPFSSGAPRS